MASPLMTIEVPEDALRHTWYEDLQGLGIGTLFTSFAVYLITHLGLMTGQTAGAAFGLLIFNGQKADDHAQNQQHDEHAVVGKVADDFLVHVRMKLAIAGLATGCSQALALRFLGSGISRKFRRFQISTFEIDRKSVV